MRRRGVWRFATIDKDSFARETANQKFYVINEPFGLCNFDQDDPSKILFRGRPGDYVASDQEGNLTLVTLEDFRLRFPPKDETQRYSPPTSDDFKRETFEQSQQTNSNNSTITNSSNSSGGTTNARSGNTGTSY